MSILIKGMEMPTRCFACPMCDVENAEVNCAISHGSYIEYREVDPKVAIQERPDWCPLIEIPPHGRLIDADELLERFNVEQKQKDMHGRGFASCFENCGELCTEWWCAEEMVENAPTVIPADEGGET